MNKTRTVRKKGKAKSRTIARPALSQQGSLHVLRRAGTILAPALYILAVLFLCQFTAVRVAMGFYENSAIERIALTTPPVPKNPVGKPQPTVGLPIRLKIPILRVNAAIQYVGRTPQGSMGIPKLARDTAWYKFGPRPGARGSAVIAGHMNWLYGATGVFQNLKKLRPGDRITVMDDKGVNTSFVVRESRAYGHKDDATDVFRSYDGKAHLNLVTCDGVWDKVTKLYSTRLVVFTDKVIE